MLLVGQYTIGSDGVLHYSGIPVDEYPDLKNGGTGAGGTPRRA